MLLQPCLAACAQKRPHSFDRLRPKDVQDMTFKAVVKQKSFMEVTKESWLWVEFLAEKR